MHKRPILPGLVLAALLCGAATAQETPFSQPPAAPPGVNADAYTTLADIMAVTQIRHEKLWHAARAENRALAGYQINLLRNTLARAAMLYVNIPVDLVLAADEPLLAMRKALDARDANAFRNAYGRFNKACNACHEAAGIGFVRIAAPRGSSFTNQDFKPRN
jgi:hypothetical protein